MHWTGIIHGPDQSTRAITEAEMLKGLGGLGDMAKLMKQAQEMQGKMADMQDALGNVEVTGESGAGLVKAVATAKGELKSLDIDPSILVASEKEVVEDLILAAVKEALTKGQEANRVEMSKLTEGLNLPPGMKLPF
jgi:DNA-binding YbaB/EbfC family protein